MSKTLIPDNWATQEGKIIVTFEPVGCNPGCPDSVALGLGYGGVGNPCYPGKADLIEISKFLSDVADTMV